MSPTDVFGVLSQYSPCLTVQRDNHRLIRWNAVIASRTTGSQFILNAPVLLVFVVCVIPEGAL